MPDSADPFAVLYPGDGSPENAVLRCLGRAGVPVALARTRRVLANRASRYCRLSFRAPEPCRAGAEVVDGLAAIARRFDRKPVLFMLHDSAVLLGSRHRDALLERWCGHFLRPETLEACNQHDRTAAAAVAAGVPVPQTALWPGTPSRVIENIPLPCVVKPVSKYVVDGERLRLEPFLRSFGRKAFLVRSAAELGAALDSCTNAGIPVVVQEYIPGGIGDLVTVVLYAVGGGIRASFTGRKLRQAPPDCGTCTYGESFPDEEAAGLASRLVRALQYDGIAEVEFKRDRRDGRLRLIEINPRATVFCLLAAEQGINLPLMAYRELTGGGAESSVLPSAHTTVRWLDPFRDLLQAHRVGDNGRIGLRAWWREFRDADIIAWGGRHDVLPLLVAPVQGLLEWIGGAMRPATFANLPPVKGPDENGYLDYWRSRSKKSGLTSVMWSNNNYNMEADRRQKGLLDAALGDLRGKKVLDFCCGTGRLSIYLARKGAEVVAVDLPCMVESARGLNPHERITYVGVDITAMDFEPEMFDAVLSVGALACICKSHEDLDGVIDRLRRVLVPGGLLVAMEPLHVCPGIRRPLRITGRAAARRFTADGFRLVSAKPLLFLPFWVVMARSWWPAPACVTSGLFRLGEAMLRVPGLAALSDYKMLVLARER